MPHNAAVEIIAPVRIEGGVDMHCKSIALALGFVLLASTASAQPLTLPGTYGLNPPGPANNSLGGEATIAGTIVPSGSVHVFDPSDLIPGTPLDPNDPFNTAVPTPVQLNTGIHPGGSVAINAAPTPLGVDFNGDPIFHTSVVLDNAPNYPILGMQNLNLDLLGGQVPFFAAGFDAFYYDQVADATLQYPGSLAATLKSLHFFQTGSATFNPAASEYSLDGTARATFDFEVDLAIGGNPAQFPNQQVEFPMTLSGNSTGVLAFPGFPFWDVFLTMEGDLNFAIPLGDTLEILQPDGPLLGVTATLDVSDLSIPMNLQYTIDDLAMVFVPEPGTVTLAAIGLLGMIPVLRRRLRR